MKHSKTLEKAFITLDDVTLRVGGQLLFEQTVWDIQSDQQWTIIGVNGSGKSTLANALCRKVAIGHGRILYFFDGESDSVPHARSFLNRGEVVIISPDTHKEFMQQYSVYHQARWQSFEGRNAPTVSTLLTGKNIEHISPYEVTPFKVSEEAYFERRQQAVRLLGIEYLLGRKILHVSHGESRKVHIARALMQSPKLLILDDPFGGLDNASRDTLRHAIDDLLAAGSPRIVLVTPRLEEIPQAITHVVCVDDNRIVTQGPKDETLHTEFGRRLSGSANLLSAPGSTDLLPVSKAGWKPAIPGATLVEMKDNSVSYGGVDVLRDINWRMKQGEHWAVLGHNGAGKTTLLSLILADNPQSYANKIILFGKRRGSGESIWDIKRHIGWMSPELQIYYHSGIACHKVVCSGFFDSIGLYQACSPGQTHVATQWMRSFGIEALADRPFSTVSAGEQRLVLLARALVKNPILLILDEPCQGLDLGHRTYIVHLLDQLCQQTPVNMIYVTHHFDEMPNSITHVLKLERGQIREKGTRRNVLGG